MQASGCLTISTADPISCIDKLFQKHSRSYVSKGEDIYPLLSSLDYSAATIQYVGKRRDFSSVSPFME